jgi:sterol desaturase/sphingolipid hydroxylase (fatty acid hydroxylase superfamily)
MEGLLKGIFLISISQLFILGYYLVCKQYTNVYIQEKRVYDVMVSVKKHLSEPEGLLLLILYLMVSWNHKWLPQSYYDTNSSVQWIDVGRQLLVQDGLQYICHRIEHAIPLLYKLTHKKHHFFTNPNLFDSFQGSILDTSFMVIMPLYVTSHIIHTNTESYIVFGTIYSSWLTLIHSEFVHIWDPYLSKLGIGTAADHHVHHKTFKYNYGHIFMYWDILCYTYRNPSYVFGKNAHR